MLECIYYYTTVKFPKMLLGTLNFYDRYIFLHYFQNFLTLGPIFHDVFYGIQAWVQKQMALLAIQLWKSS